VLPGGGTAPLPAAQEVRAHTDGQLSQRGLREATGTEYRYQVGRTVNFPLFFNVRRAPSTEPFRNRREISPGFVWPR